MTRLRRPLTILGTLVFVAALAVGWVFLAPPSVGGRTSFSFTYGTSMEPLLHKGDLVAIRSGGTPRIGDVAVYYNPDLKRHVLHRILRADGDRFVMKGDNNGFADTYEPTRDEILGKLWFTVGGAGNWGAWTAKPLHAALLTGGIALLSLLASGLKAGRRARTRRRDGATTGGSSPRGPAPDGGVLSGQSTQVVGGVLGLVALACGVLALVALTRPVTTLGDGPSRYAHQGTFTYEATVPTGAVYANGKLTTGQPAYVKVVRSILVRFAYRLDTRAGHQVFGTTRLTAEIANGSGWSRRFELAPAKQFSGDTAQVGGILRLAELRSLADKVEAVTGQVPDTYTVRIRPTVAVHGQVAGATLADTFAPPLQLALDRYKLALPPSGTSTDSELIRTQDGPATRQRVAGTLSLAGARMQVTTARRLALVAGLGSLAGVLGILVAFLLGLRRADEPARIQARYGQLIVQMLEPRRRFLEHDVVLATFEDLVRVAERHARMILHARDGQSHVYLVEDDGVAYRYEIAGPGTATGWDGPAGPDGDGGSRGDRPVDAAPVLR